MPTPGAVFAMIIFGSIGMAAFIYGKRDFKVKPMGIGLVLMIYPYFISGTGWIYLVGALLTAGLFYPRD